MRVEKDSLGEKAIPENAYYSINTARSIENFIIGSEILPHDIIYAIVKLKLACAHANIELGNLERVKGQAIIRACDLILKGEFDAHFSVNVFQAGSGTSSNMNVNEVLANIACEELGTHRGDRNIVHPNDDVNKGQSTNNIFPSAIRIAVIELSKKLIKSLESLSKAFREKEKAFADVLKSGRTHLRDAVPITLGQEFGAYARAVEKDLHRIGKARESLYELGIGGNAVGTGVNTKKVFRFVIIQRLKTLTEEPFRVAENGIEATQFLTDIAELSSVLKLLSLDIQKIVNDLRLLSSGPNTGLGEIDLPPVEPGSSIMPGKINPSICEAVNMACIQVIGYDHTIALSCGAGQLELNTYMPLIGTNIVKSIIVLDDCCQSLVEKCISGIRVNRDICRDHFETSMGLATVLNPILGYDSVAELVKESLATKKMLKELILEKGIISESEWHKITMSSTEPESD
ncbi:MAG: aspartate ammonia-lyase [Spirochaetota bacterium]|nr:aspartate ammonia-lyase [Spirochaetota bacterium]